MVLCETLQKACPCARPTIRAMTTAMCHGVRLFGTFECATGDDLRLGHILHMHMTMICVWGTFQVPQTAVFGKTGLLLPKMTRFLYPKRASPPTVMPECAPNAHLRHNEPV